MQQTINDVESKVLPCPFCEESEDLQIDEWCVICGKCGAMGPNIEFNEVNPEKVVMLWNKARRLNG